MLQIEQDLLNLARLRAELTTADARVMTGQTVMADREGSRGPHAATRGDATGLSGMSWRGDRGCL